MNLLIYWEDVDIVFIKYNFKLEMNLLRGQRQSKSALRQAQPPRLLAQSTRLQSRLISLKHYS